MRGLRLKVLFIALALAVSSSAFANGRFPRAQRLLEMPSNPDGLLLAATYGLLLTPDRGASWRHLCELAFVFTTDDVDPIPAFTSDGSLLVKGSHSLNRGVPPYCDFEPVLGGDGTEQVPDFSLDPENPERVIALFMKSVTGGIQNSLYESHDGGSSFQALGTVLPSDEVAFSVTLDAAPSDPDRLYVTALDRQGSPRLVRSFDRGETWEVLPIPGEFGEIAYLGAVDPEDPDVLYVRTDYFALNEKALQVADDKLFVSEDAGESFRELFRAEGKLFGFALASDGSELLIGYGDPVDPVRGVDPAVLGIYRGARADGFAFTKIFDGPVSCLRWTENGLYACTSQSVHGYALGFSETVNFDRTDSEPFTPLLDLTLVEGPYECPACSGGGRCPERWADSCGVFGNCDVPIAGAPSECKDGGAGGSGAGGSDSGGNAGSAAGAGGAAAAERGSGGSGGDSGCSCRSAAPGGYGFALGLFSLLALWRFRVRSGRGVSARPRA